METVSPDSSPEIKTKKRATKKRKIESDSSEDEVKDGGSNVKKSPPKKSALNGKTEEKLKENTERSKNVETKAENEEKSAGKEKQTLNMFFGVFKSFTLGICWFYFN